MAFQPGLRVNDCDSHCACMPPGGSNRPTRSSQPGIPDREKGPEMLVLILVWSRFVSCQEPAFSRSPPGSLGWRRGFEPRAGLLGIKLPLIGCRPAADSMEITGLNSGFIWGVTRITRCMPFTAKPVNDPGPIVGPAPRSRSTRMTSLGVGRTTYGELRRCPALPCRPSRWARLAGDSGA